MQTRIPRLKQSLVRVHVNGNASGTGFIVGDHGNVITCFHVVQQVVPAGLSRQITIGTAAHIEIETFAGQRLPATVSQKFQGSGLLTAITADFIVLQVQGISLPGLSLGSFADVAEGEDIYLGGFPLGIVQPVFAHGMLSTKWSAPPHLVQQGQTREVAWLDITMNRGNSGGPVLRMGRTADEDNVIGIASFGLNPFGSAMEEVVAIAQSFPGEVTAAGVSIGHFAAVVGQALAANSLGIGGCVAIDYAKSACQS